MKATDRIEDKIKKLLALSQSSNPNEAKAALLKAQELMLKYNLSMDYETDTSEIITDFLDIKYDKYHLQMALIIAENFRTRTWAGRNKLYYIGYREDVIASKSCLDYLVNESYKCYSRYMYENEASLPSITKSYSRYLYRQWMEGFVSGIRDSFDERKNDPEYELMLITPEEVKKEYEKLNLYDLNLRKKEPTNRDAFDAGFTEGKQVLDRRSLKGDA